MKLKIPDQTFSGHIFDCDATIAATMPLHYRAWTKVMNDFGGIFSEDLFYSWGGRPTATIFGMLNKNFGFSMDVDRTVRRKEDYYPEMIPEVTPISEVLAIASGGHHELVDPTLDALGITKMFQAIICAEDYVNVKPAPDTFLVAAPECIVFEDSPTGIEVAKAVGMAWVFVASGNIL